jgi:NDP-sugar pyrophosphorylase family protein
LKLPPLFWLARKRLRHLFAAFWWSGRYRTYLRLHPACRSLGRLRVTGRVHWDLDPYAELHLGDEVRINSGPLINLIGGHRITIIGLLRGARLAIGRGTGLSGCTIVCMSSIEIGADVLIGGGVIIVDSDMHALKPADRSDATRVRTAPVSIGDRVFIGMDTIILKGVSIGSDAVIGAGSVVRNDIPAGEIWGGNPARRIGREGDASTRAAVIAAASLPQ